MSTALRVLRPDCAKCFWCVIVHVIVTSTRDHPFFTWVKVLIFFMCSGNLKIISFMIFHKHEQMIFFLLCMNLVNTCVIPVAWEMIQMPCSARALMLMFIQCTDLRFVHWTSIKYQRGCAGFESFLSQKNFRIYWPINSALTMLRLFFYLHMTSWPATKPCISSSYVYLDSHVVMVQLPTN